MIEDIHGDSVIIYRFDPHGSKNLADLKPLSKDPDKCWMFAHVYCHDQEPVNYDYYEQQTFGDQRFAEIRQTLTGHARRVHTNFRNTVDINNMALLLHSEKNSTDIDRYRQDSVLPVYYWSHAIIAQDWYRVAEHIVQKKQQKKIFLIYNRAWSGTRQYRLKFVEKLLDSQLQHHCHTSFNTTEPELKLHYKDFNFDKDCWKPVRDLDNIFMETKANSNSSADFDIADYEATEIEVVLETLFDEQKIHLTEKSLRPIALGQPFILASSPGSLKYLREYGFKTFSDIWSEEYDLETDSVKRMDAIIESMTSISQWSDREKSQKLAQAKHIADYNKQLFFSKEFFKTVTDELKSNLTTALQQFSKENAYNKWYDRWSKLLEYSEITDYLKTKNSPLFNTNLLSKTLSHIDTITK